MTQNIFGRMEDGRHAAIEAENAIGEILGVELLGLGFDDYDNSFEIYPDGDVVDVIPTEEQHAAILALGCSRYWINFRDGTERYGRGTRSKATSNRWESHNSYKDRPRSEELDAARYRWLLTNYARGDGYDAIDAALNDGEADTQLSPAIDAAMAASA